MGGIVVLKEQRGPEEGVDAMGRSIGICPRGDRESRDGIGDWRSGVGGDAERNVMRQPRVSSCRGSRETRDLI